MARRISVTLVLCVALIAAGCSSGTQADTGAEGLDLRPDGIGPFLIGQPADEVISGLSALIGGTDADSRDPDTAIPVPDCGGTDTWIASWGTLVLSFTATIGEPVFTTWSYGFDPITGDAGDTRGLGLVTDEGVGLGSTRSELIEAYGFRMAITDDAAIDLSTFTIDESDAEHLAGRLSSVDEEATVELIERRPACEF